jgi:hypothetical protein
LARIFSVLALLAVGLLAANFLVGLWVGDFNAAAQEKRAAQGRMIELQNALRLDRRKTSPALEQMRSEYAAADARFQTPRSRMTIHMLLGAAGTLVAILVNCITITYFIGTSRWCQEVSDTYRLPAELAQRSTRLKRSTFPWAVMSVVALIALVTLGAAADPSGANFSHSADFVLLHYAASIVTLLIVAASFWVQISRIAANYAVIEEILSAVKQIRERQGQTAGAKGWEAT